MKYLTTLMAVCLLLAACGDSRNEPAVSSRSGDHSEIELLNRPSTVKDRLPSGTEQQLARTVIVDRSSVRHATTLKRGWSIWAFRGTLRGAAALGAGDVTCLAVLGRHREILAEKCCPEEALVDPRRTTIVLGGGANGAGGLGQREVLVIGLLGRGVHDPALLADGPQAGGGGAGVYWISSRAPVRGARFEIGGGGALEMKFDACQSC